MEAPPRAPGEDLRAIYTAMACGVVVYDAADTIIYANTAAQLIMGLTGTQLQGRTSLDARWQAVHEDGSDCPGMEHPARVALRTGQAQHGTIIGVLQPSGARRWLQVDAVPTLGIGGGAVRQVVTSFVDVTARFELERTLRASEARFRAMSDFNGDLIMVVDGHGILQYVSQSHRRLLGFAGEQAEGRSIFDFIHPNDLAHARVALDLNVRAVGSIAHGELRFRHADGSWRTFEIVRNNLLDDPMLQGLLIAARDITARVRAERAAAQLAAIVQSSDDAITSINLDGLTPAWPASQASPA